MYAVCAQVNDISVVNCPLEVSGEFGEGGNRGRFSLRVDEASHPITPRPELSATILSLGKYLDEESDRQ
jgi:histidinol-phosphate aminotransferase